MQLDLEEGLDDFNDFFEGDSGLDLLNFFESESKENRNANE